MLNLKPGFDAITHGIQEGASNIIKTIGTGLANPNLLIGTGPKLVDPLSEATAKAAYEKGQKIRTLISKIKDTYGLGEKATPTEEKTAVPTPQPDVQVAEETEKTMQKELEEYYAREDAIRKETQEREDTAYQRAVADMRKAGIDPNLLGVTPAASGGGISSATTKDLTRFSEETNVMLTLLTQALEHEFTGDENAKNRIANTINTVINALSKKKLI